MKTLETYFKNRKHSLNLILEKAPSSYTAKTFHELRVEIKKLKALFELVAFCNKKFKMQKLLKPFRIIFKQAGKIRELQLEQSLLKEQPNFNLVKKYHNRLIKLETKGVKKFFSIADKHFIKKLKKNYPKIIHFLAKTNKKKVNRYRNKITKEIKNLIHKNAFKKNQMHDFRKRLKVYQHNENIFPANQSIKLIPDKTFLSDMLGEWHDYEVVILHLKKTIPSFKTNSSEITHLKSIKAIVISKRELLFHKINTTLPYECRCS